MAIEIKEVKSRRDLRRFIHLPQKIHAAYSNWLPPIYVDEWKFFDARKNHSFDSCSTVLALAYRDGKPAGRIMGIIHHKYNELHNELNGRFGYFDSWNDPEVAHALISHIEDWAENQGMDKLVGPYGFSDKDIQGVLVEGFEHLPLIDSASNPPYIVELIENEGYVKEIDCMTYRFPLTIDLPELYYRILQRTNQQREYHVLEFTSKKELKPYIVPVLQLVNETFNELFGFVPMTDIEIRELAERYLPVIDPRFVKLVEKNNKVVGFLVAIPNLTPGIQKSKGHLFPFGIFHILKAARKSHQLDLMLGAVKRELQGLGLEIAMGLRLVESARKAGFEYMEAHLILETNRKMQAEMGRLNLPPHKRFRVYQKVLR